MSKNELQVFSFESQDIRTVEKDGELLWVVVDVCRVLGHSNPTMAVERVAEDALSSTEVIDSLGRVQRVNAVNEKGLYALIMGSRKPEALRFQDWVYGEVLPSIRKTGKYSIREERNPYVEGSDEFKAVNDVMLLIGMSKTQAFIAANREVKRIRGIDYLKIAGDDFSLKCDVQEAELNASSVGVQVGLSSVKVNQIACKLGLIKALRDKKSRIYYTVTEEGKDYCFLKDVQIDDKKSSKQQLMYYYSAVN